MVMVSISLALASLLFALQTILLFLAGTWGGGDGRTVDMELCKDENVGSLAIMVLLCLLSYYSSLMFSCPIVSAKY